MVILEGDCRGSYCNRKSGYLVNYWWSTSSIAKVKDTIYILCVVENCLSVGNPPWLIVTISKYFALILLNYGTATCIKVYYYLILMKPWHSSCTREIRISSACVLVSMETFSYVYCSTFWMFNLFAYFREGREILETLGLLEWTVKMWVDNNYCELETF